ncbi:hypothetical protein H257_06699 [Aphanomyces astaci]|uniref:WW domain-containing protein n=1 Tax=Aphanomyces astaci TaxID=112090 RepID=W4GL18_APHAT|nr:hypothetical protein H257_06699 [Aphanomyces astaci]ETV80390.1 hypothetical protein H257_06699 [Aphanomyces astaci]|eukprot:XP_009830314.1 hypothetical protein H257_06699 [Aphanomyces astaci]
MDLCHPIDDVRAILNPRGILHDSAPTLPQNSVSRNGDHHPAAQLHSDDVQATSGARAPAGYTRSSWAYTHVLEPLVACAMENACIAPPGKNPSNHRHGQTDDLNGSRRPSTTSKKSPGPTAKNERYTKVYCMSTPPQQSDDDITASLGVILDCESHVQMQGLVLGLTQEDLEALARFPSHPHRAVHLLLAMVYLILHECAVQRDCLPPSMILLTWTFLRENLLRNCGALFLRLRRRLRNQSPVVPMITHVCVLYLRDPTFRIQALRKVSAIAAALASWVLLCLQASLPCKLDGRDVVELHQVQHTPTRPAFRFALRLHGRCTLCSVRIASHEAVFQWCGPNSFHKSTVRRRLDAHFEALVDNTLPPFAFRSWVQNLLNASTSPTNNDGSDDGGVLQLPSVLRLYFVVVRPPNVVGVGLVVVDPTMSLRQCRRAIQDQYGWHMAIYYRGTRVSAAMETKLDARHVLPMLLLSPRQAKYRAIAPALALLHTISTASITLHSGHDTASSVTTLPHVTSCPMHRALLDSELATQLTRLFELWATHGHACVVDTCIAQMTSKDRSADRVESSDMIANLDGSATVVENSPKRKVLLSKPVPYAAELHELARKLHIFTEADALGDMHTAMKAPRESTYRYLPLYVYASVELIEVSATTETYKCELVSSVAMAHKKTPRSVFTKGVILRLGAGRQVTVETSWDDDQRAFAVCKPAGGPVLPPMSNVWLVVESQHDKRPQWLHDLQAYICHPTIEFDGSRDFYTLFRVRLPYFTPEHIVEGGLWSRDVDWRPIIAKTPCDALVDDKFHELCASYPSNFFIDSVKFSKFIRDCHVLPAKLSLGSLDGIFHRFAMLRFQMDLGGFRAAIALVVHHVTKKHMTNTPLLYFFLHYMILSPSMRGIWDQTMQTYRLEAKMAAMQALARQICAATRLQASYRGHVTYAQFKHHWAMMRRRRQAATTIVSCFKMLYCKRQFQQLQREAVVERAMELARLERLQREEAERLFMLNCHVTLQVWVKHRLWKKRRVRLLCPEWIARKQRICTRKRLRIARLACHVGGHLMTVTVFRSHIDQAKNSKMHVELYQASDSRTFSYDVHESTVQGIWAALADHHKLDPTQFRNRLDGLLRRLHVNTAMQRVKMHSSDDRCGRGRLLARVACTVQDRIRGIAQVFLRHFHMDVLLYVPSDCRSTKWVLDIAFVQQVLQMAQPTLLPRPWTCCGIAFASDCHDVMTCRQRVAHVVECARNDFPFLPMLIKYVATYGSISMPPTTHFAPKHLEAVAQHLPSRPSYSIERRFEAATRLQAIWLGYRTRQYVAHLLQGNFAISYDRAAGHLWYQSRTTNHCFKSAPLGHILRVTYPPPSDTWLPQNDSQGRVYYFNPSRGLSSWFNLETATRKVQRVFRHRRHAAIGGLTMQHLARAVAFHHFNEDQTSKMSSSRLSPTDMERLALHHHTITHDFNKAIALYDQLLQSHPRHEVVASTCLAMLLIATGRAPLKKNAARAVALLQTARKLDGSLHNVVSLELACFRWAVLVTPNDAMAMAMYAVFAEEVLNDIDKAELLYRRALALDPGHAVTVDNYANLVKERTPHGRYAAAGPGRVAHQRAYVVDTVGQWQQLRDSQTNTTFWHNHSTKQLQWDAPQT